MNILNKFIILSFYSTFFFQLNNCQEILNENQEITKKPIPKSGRIYNTTINRFSNVKTIPAIKTNDFFTTTRSTFITSAIDNDINSNSFEVINGAEANVNTEKFTNSTLNENEFLKNANWTSGFGTHYGPFPSNPHFSEVGYQPNDVGVGCSDGRPGGDPQWNNILSKGVYPAPNIVNHEKTVWPVAYTVAVSAAVWNKEDVCWKTIKIRNKNKPELFIEAYIVDFCPIGYCQWRDKYLARNVDIYGEKAWLALGADINESKLDIEIEWPKGAIPHDAIKLKSFGFSKVSKSIMMIIVPLTTILVYIYAF